MEIYSNSEKNKEAKKNFSSLDFWIERWGSEKENYIPGKLSLYKGNLKALKKIINRNNICLNRKYVLDAATGKGFYSQFYRKYYQSAIFSCDISPWIVQKMKEKKFFSCVLDLGSEYEEFKKIFSIKFDWVHCTQTLVHMVRDDHFIRACNNLSSCVKEGKYLLIGDRFLPDPEKAGKKHIKLRFPIDYEIQFRRNGLHIIDIEPSFGVRGQLLLFKKGK